LSFAREQGNTTTAARLQTWLDLVQKRLALLLDRPDMLLHFNLDRFQYQLKFADRTVDLDVIPDGFASLMSIWSEILLREEVHMQTYDALPAFGFVVIDELESHLHLALQEQVLGLLTEWHPKYQFVIATHAPPILSSVDDALVVDLGSNERVRSSELRGIPYGDLMTGHFRLSSDMDLETTALLGEFRSAARRDDHVTVQKLGAQLSERSDTLALEVWRQRQVSERSQS